MRLTTLLGALLVRQAARLGLSAPAIDPAAPGSDYFLANYTQTEAWLKKVAGASV